MNGLIATAILIAIVATLLFFYILHHKDEAMAEYLNKNIEIKVHGYWLDDGEKFSYTAVIGNATTGKWNGEYPTNIFMFNSPEEVIGTHNNEYHIISYEEIKHD